MKQMRHIHTPEVQELIGHESITNPAIVNTVEHLAAVDSEQLGGIQLHAMAVAEPKTQPEAVIIHPVAWSDYNQRPFQALRLGTIADFTGARTIGLDVPGMGNVESESTHSLSEKQAEDFNNGRMQNLAETYWEAMQKEGLLTDAQGQPLPVTLWGHSLSALTVSELLAAAPEGVTIQEVVLSEPMALRKLSVARLAAAFLLKGGKDLNKYHKMNTGMPEHTDAGLVGLAKQVVKQPASHLLVAKVLTHGKQLDILHEARKLGRLDNGIRVRVVTAEDGLSPVQETAQLVETLSSFGLNDEQLQVETLNGEAHGYQDSLPALLSQLSKLAIANR